MRRCLLLACLLLTCVSVRASDAGADLRKRLLTIGRSDWYSVSGPGGEALLVVEKGYLEPARVAALAADVKEAMRDIPSYAGRPAAYRGRVTIYVYDQGPMSEADVPGAQPGEKGLMLRFVKEGTEPLFHELTHMLVGYGDSQSLGEGIADVFHDHFRPGSAHAFVPANTDPDVRARDAVAKYRPAFLEAVGAPGWSSWSGQEVRFDFYYASWSFARYLIGLKGMKAFLSVMDAGGTEASYRAAYGRGLDELRGSWLTAIRNKSVNAIP